MTTEQMIEVMSAFTRGEKIECRDRGCVEWDTMTLPHWNWCEFSYRIAKPEQKKVILGKLIHKNGCVIEGVIGSPWYNQMVESCGATPFEYVYLTKEITLP